MTPPSAPGERGWPAVGHLPRMLVDPMKFLTDLTRRHGDVAAFRLGRRPAVLVNHPALITRLLRDRTCPRSDESRWALHSFLGDGLLNLEGRRHLRHRRLMAPAFHKKRIRAYAELMATEAHAEIANWRADEVRDLREDMMRLTFVIVSKALFSADTRDEARDVERALSVVLPWAMLGAALKGVFPNRPVYYPRSSRIAIQRLHEVVLSVVTRRRREGGDRGDLLSMLLEARDEDGSALNDEEICSEALTLLLSGHDTTASTLTWAWHLLAENPDVQDAAYSQIQRVVGDRPVSPEDIPKLGMVQQILDETLRLYPVIWVGDRVPERDMELGGYHVAKGTSVLFSMYVTQRDPRFFPDPERFDPGRFSEGRAREIPEGAYLPFGTGVHMCIGNAFALTEARIILAAVLQRYCLRKIRGHKVRPDPQIVMTPRGRFPAVLRARSAAVRRGPVPSATTQPAAGS